MPQASFLRSTFMTVLGMGAAGCLLCLLGWAYLVGPAWSGQDSVEPGMVIGCPEVSERPRLSDPVEPANSDPQPSPPRQPVQDWAKGSRPDKRTDAKVLPPPLEADEAVQGMSPETIAASPESIDGESIEAAVAQAATVSEESSTVKVRLFDTVEFKRPLSTLPAWLDLLKRNKLAPIFIPGKYFKKSMSWEDFRSAARGKSPMELLRLVNSFWNTWPYKTDMANWGREDYWECPDEFLKKSGDCEDYAIIKYFTLKELGIPPENMRIVVVRDTIRNLAHAILAVYLNNNAYILDNLSNAVLSHSRLRQYSPQYSVNESGRWAHLKGRKIN